MQKKLLKPLLTYWKIIKTEKRLRPYKYSAILTAFQLLADLITNTAIVIGILLVTFLISVTLSFSLSVFFGSHVKGFLAATLCLTLTAAIVIWKRQKVETYFSGLAIAKYFEKRYLYKKEAISNTDSNDRSK